MINKSINKIEQYIYLAIILLFSLTCQKEKVSLREYPRIEISDEVIQNEAGVTFKANIITEGNSAIINAGFVWHTGNGSPTINSSRVFVDKHLGIGEFTATSKIDFVKGTTYTVRAFVQTEDYIVYSKIIQFESTFSSPVPELIDFNPKRAHWGDTLEIKSKNLSFFKENLKVFFGTIPAEIHYFTDTAINVTVPDKENIGSAKIRVQVYDKSTTFIDDFNYIQPEIYDFRPKKITNNDTITITGKDFHYNRKYCIVNIGDFESDIIANSSSEIKAIISLGEKDSEVSITDTLNVSITSEGKTLKANDDLIFEYYSRWTKMRNFPGQVRKLAVGFSYNGKGYYGLGIHPYSYANGAYTDLWEYDPIEDKWTQKASFPTYGREDPSCFQINEMFYVCFGNSDHYQSKTEVWRYDIENDVWLQMNDFPGAARTGAIEFSIDGKGYIIGGSNYSSYEVWEYESSSDIWVPRVNSTKPNYLQKELSIELGEFGYVLGDYVGTGRECYRYSPNAETWEQLSNSPQAISQGTCFVINNKLYFGTGFSYIGFIVYNPENSSWSTFSYKGGETREASSFVIDNKAYIIGGWYHTSSAPYRNGRKDVWQFDPSK